MAYIVIGLLIGALIYRQGIIDGQKIKSGAVMTNNPVKPVVNSLKRNKDEKEMDEFSAALDEMLSYKGVNNFER